ncbi:hypothetical protein GH714_033809 [Hevea brasiliensis]|uniref:Retrotransposon gag domain-containing protein n=1 Tax=Hevea brasiliensis TaxID=3981 RepID=A0A6A6NE66_HEVBR|nr:hypothetical protein GH714_033809 [Hevea brasiliensis]
MRLEKSRAVGSHQNQFSGLLPECIGNLTNLQALESSSQCNSRPINEIVQIGEVDVVDAGLEESVALSASDGTRNSLLSTPNPIEQDIALSLRPFSTANEIWVHLQKLYSQPNHARLFEIEYEIAGINQDDRDVRTFHSELLGLWTELDMVSMSLVDKSAYADLKKERDRNRVLQFLVKLRPEFENIRATIVNLGITDFDSVLGEILRRKLGCKLKLI